MSKEKGQLQGINRTFASLDNSTRAKKVQPPTSDAEKAQRKAEGRTRGRTGCKKDRINLAFTVDNYEFIKRFCKYRGENMTDFVNHIIEEYRKANIKEFEAFEKFVNKT